MRRSLASLLATAALAPAARTQTAGAPVEIPAEFRGGRVIVHAVTAEGDTLLLHRHGRRHGHDLPRRRRAPGAGGRLGGCGRRADRRRRLDLLYDSGATLSLTDSAHAALADGGPKIRGTSFITASVRRGHLRAALTG